jgi:hypothetical protein
MNIETATIEEIAISAWRTAEMEEDLGTAYENGETDALALVDALYALRKWQDAGYEGEPSALASIGWIIAKQAEALAEKI